MLPPFITQLYSSTVSAPGRAVLLLMKIGEIPYCLNKIDVTNGEHMSVKMVELNPNHTLPILKGEKETLYGTSTILKFLCSQYGLETWYPLSTENSGTRARIEQYLEWHHNHLHPASREIASVTTGIPDFDGFGDTSQKTDEENGDIMDHAASVMKLYIDTLSIVEKSYLDKSPFLVGDVPTIADLVAVTELTFHKVVNADLSQFPKLMQWYERTIKYLQAYWDDVNSDFDQFVQQAGEKQKKQQEQQLKIKRYGKDAKGGTKQPDINHIIYFQTTPVTEVYERLTSEEKLNQYLKAKCEFSAKPGGQFKYYDGTIVGTNLYLMENIKVMQSWRMEEWPKNVFSTVKYTLQKMEGGGTELTMTASDVPPACLQKTDNWWLNQMWRPMEGVLTRNIIRQVFFEGAIPHDIYELLMDATKLSKLTRSQCKISRGVGADFEMLDGSVTGKNLDLVTDAKIVQKWRSSDWAKDHYSTVSFELKRVPGGTDLVFTQENVPVEKVTAVRDLWEKKWFTKMKQQAKA